MGSRIQKAIKKQQAIADEMKKVAKGAGRSVAELAPWTDFEEAEPLPQLPEDRIFINSRYQVNIRMGEAPAPFGVFIQLSIKTRDKAAYHDWRDFQRIKNELVGSHFEAVELYPSEKRLVDTANQFYVFVFPELQFPSNQFPFGFRDRLVSEIGLPEAPNTRQRPFESKPVDLETPETLKERIEEMMKEKQGKVDARQSVIPNQG